MKTRAHYRVDQGTRVSGRRALLLALIVGSLMAALSPATVLANSDPHRTFLGAQPFDLPAGICNFPVHLTFPLNREYGTISTAADGSTVVKATGFLEVTASNKLTGAALTLNVSGPGTFSFSADGTTERLEGHGLGLFFVTNGPQFGLPSNLVLTSGLLDATIDLGTNSLTSLNRPHVLLDVCAALA